MYKMIGLLILITGAVGLARADDNHHWHDQGWNSDSGQHDWRDGSDWHVAVSAPEIDPASALSGLTLLVGGVVVARGRRRR